jgi:hypothetical protein
MARKFSFSLAHSNKLEGLANYIVWKVKMKMIFKIEKLWDVIIASGTIATMVVAIKITTTIKGIATIATTSSSFSSMVAQ